MNKKPNRLIRKRTAPPTLNAMPVPENIANQRVEDVKRAMDSENSGDQNKLKIKVAGSNLEKQNTSPRTLKIKSPYSADTLPHNTQPVLLKSDSPKSDRSLRIKGRTNETQKRMQVHTPNEQAEAPTTNLKVRKLTANPKVVESSDRTVSELHKKRSSIREITDTRGVEFVYVPPGVIYYGPECEDAKIHAGFYISKYPVTRAEFLEYINGGMVVLSKAEMKSLDDVSPYDKSPAVNMSWNDAKNYCRWLRGFTGEYYSLPSDIEWEAAARSNDGREYPWGDEIEPNSDYACFDDGEFTPASTAAVDYYTKNCSPCGAIGMVGNVMEWTIDNFDDDRDPHILRGGAWKSTIDMINTHAKCISYPPTKRQDYAGARILYLPPKLYKIYSIMHRDK